VGRQGKLAAAGVEVDLQEFLSPVENWKSHYDSGPGFVLLWIGYILIPRGSWI